MKSGLLIAKYWRTHCSTTCHSRIYLALRSYSINAAEKYGFSKKDVKEFNFITNILKPWADKTPNHCALSLSDGDKSTKLTYKELLMTSQYLANSLHDMKTPKSALVILPKISPWWTITAAGSFTGMVICPGTIMLTEKEVSYRLESSNADTIFCSSDLMQKYDKVTSHLPHRILVEENKEDEPPLRNGWLSYHDLVREGKQLENVKPIKDGEAIVQLFFTSGTSGTPKMVPHTQAGFGIGLHEAAREICQITPSDIFWNMSDLGWAKSAFGSFYIPLISGCTIFIHQMPRFDPKVIIKTIQKESITLICLPATGMRSLIKEDISSLRHSSLNRAISGGEPLDSDIMKTWNARTGTPIYEVYGQTETTLTVANIPDVLQKPGSMGKPISSFDIAITDDDGNELPDNEIGQVAVKIKDFWPYGLFKGYYKNEEKTKKAFVNDVYLTGDRAYRDKDGYLWYVCRNDDVINSAGYRIGPLEVELALLEHPAVSECAVVASPDSYRGHVVKAFILLNEKFANKSTNENDAAELKKDIQEFVKRSISAYKCPRKIEFVENLPRTISGKVKRSELREGELSKRNITQDETDK